MFVVVVVVCLTLLGKRRESRYILYIHTLFFTSFFRNLRLFYSLPFFRPFISVYRIWMRYGLGQWRVEDVNGFEYES